MKKYTQINDVVELCIPPQLEPELKKIFENEMRHGFIKTLADGRKHYRFRIHEGKAKLLHDVSQSFETELLLNQFLS